MALFFEGHIIFFLNSIKLKLKTHTKCERSVFAIFYLQGESCSVASAQLTSAPLSLVLVTVWFPL
jgi:hypothetical protein